MCQRRHGYSPDCRQAPHLVSSCRFQRLREYECAPWGSLAVVIDSLRLAHDSDAERSGTHSVLDAAVAKLGHQQSQGFGFCELGCRIGSMTCALAAVDVKDFACHEAGRLEVEDRVDDVGDLAYMADRVQSAELRIGLDGVHRRLDGPRPHPLHPDTALP